MTVDSIHADLVAIEREHQHVNDGGYRLVSALCAYRSGLPVGKATMWDQVLLRWVRDEPARFWGVGLEALARAGGPGVDEELAAMLGQNGRPEEWQEYLANALIRRGFSCAELEGRVEAAALRMSPMGLPNLAALLPLVPGMTAVAVAAIVRAMHSGEQGYVRSNVPPLVSAAARSDPELLVRLVQGVVAEDRGGGVQFAEMIADYLSRPFVRRRFPAGIGEELERRVLDARFDR